LQDWVCGIQLPIIGARSNDRQEKRGLEFDFAANCAKFLTAPKPSLP